MNLELFQSIIEAKDNPVIVMEGKREIPEFYSKKAFELGYQLALNFPEIKFRSGNAKGSDEAFIKGVASVDESRVEIIVPYEGHREKERLLSASYFSPEMLTTEDEKYIVEKTIKASPKNKNLIEKRHQSKSLNAKSKYLIRDTMKITGIKGRISKPVLAFFYTDPENRLSGGTGHTIKVCMEENIPYFYQEKWINLLKDLTKL
jgi:hypothetical protein